MNQSFTFAVRRGLAAGFSFLALAFASSALALGGPANEVGRWLGFAHGPVNASTAQSKVVLDLALGTTAAGPMLQGVISGLPAVQMPLAVSGSVSRQGRLTLLLRRPDNQNLVGFCDGSVMPIGNFGPGSGQDDLGSLDFVLVSDTGGPITGHMNLLHLFGGAQWQMAGLDWSRFGGLPGQGQSHGAFMGDGSDQAGLSSFFGSQDGGQASSSFTGGVRVGSVELSMVGTVNGRGSLVMMCDGSVRTGDQNALIGLLFTGGVAPSPASTNLPQTDVVGKFGVAGFGELLPAVQKIREAAMSFSWGAR